MTSSLLGRWSFVVGELQPLPFPLDARSSTGVAIVEPRTLVERGLAPSYSASAAGDAASHVSTGNQTFPPAIHSVPLEGITTTFSAVVFSGKSSTSITVRATVSADIILRLGAFGHSVSQIAVSVAPGIRAITRMPFGLNYSRNVLVNPRAPCFDAL